MSSTLSASESSGSRPSAIELTHRFDRVLLELSMSDAVTSGNLEAALHDICAAASRALRVSRTNVWLFDRSHSCLREAVSVARDDDAEPPATLRVEDNPPYFAALQQERIIAAGDVYADPRTTRFAATYLRPRGITATLDAAIRQHGELLGVICHEHVGASRRWEAEEESFAASLGDLVALAIVADGRAAAQRAVLASEARYRLLVDGVRDLIFNLDTLGTLTSINPAIEDLLGFSASDWIGRHFSGLLHPDDVAAGYQVFQRALSGAEVPNFEIRLRDARGQAQWFEFTISVERDGPRVRHVFGAGRDITARKLAERRRHVLAEVAQALACSDDLDEALRAVHQQLAETLGCTHVATVLRDPTGGAPERILHHAAAPGARGDEAAGTPFPPSALVERTLLRGEPGVVHERRVAPSGEEIAGASAACPLRAPDGILGAIVARRAGPAGFDGAQIDLLDGVAREVVLAIAAARRRQEARENAALSAALARVGQELITSVDLPLLLERLCRVTTEVLGCDASYTFLRDERLGGFVRMASYGDPPQLAEALRTLPILDEHTGGLVERLERDWVVVEHAEDGSVAPALWSAYGTRSSMVIALLHGARVVGAQAASFRHDDATFGPQHLRIGQGIAQLASLAIANARLVSELEAASRIKSDFVATISHELRTPLNVILGYSDLLLLGDFGALTPQQDDPLRRVRSSATELQQLIEATLDLSRLESGAATLRLEQVDLQRWLDEVRNETAPLCERRPQIEVRWHARLPGEPVRCDAIKLKVILKNLIGNALKFTPRGFVEVGVAAQHDMLTLSVADSGIGMAPEVRAVIFEAFRQGDASMTRSHGGVGLGLYIVHRLVDAMRGRIEVTSEPGRGSTFLVEVPLDPRSTPSGQRSSAAPTR